MRQQVEGQNSHIPVSLVYLIYPSSSYKHQADMKAVFHASMYPRFRGIKSNFRKRKLHRRNLGSNFLGDSFRSGAM